MAKEDHYKGIIDCVVRINREQGFLSFWRGNNVNMIRSIPNQALNFAYRDQLQSFFLEGVNKEDRWRFMLGNFAAGGAAGVISLSILYPLDFARTRVAVDIGVNAARRERNMNGAANTKTRQFNGLYDCLKQISATDGIRGIYQGFSMSIIGIAIYRSCYFGIYDSGKGIIFKDTENAPIYMKWLIAQCATATAGLISFPFDTVRRRMMMQAGIPPAERNYHSVEDCVSKILREEGVRTFYIGSMTNILRSASGAIVLILYDEIKKIHFPID